VIVGAAVAGVGIWYIVHARPVVGDVVATIPMDPRAQLVVRSQVGAERDFLELRVDDDVKWRALIPHYAGAPDRPAVAWSATAVTVRVERDGHAEVFGFAMHDAQKIGDFRLAPEHEPITTQPTGPITLTDHVRSYEIVGGAAWHQLIAVELASGKGVWKTDLGPAPVTGGGVSVGQVWIVQGDAKHVFDPMHGTIIDPSTPAKSL
jgi:hypothetical protein